MRQIQLSLILILAASSAACGSNYPGGEFGQSGDGTLWEQEPNDDAAHADYLGEIYAGDFIAVEGHISECCGDDYDGFSFYAVEPVSVYITLHEFNPVADLDFGIYIPEIDQFVDSWETTNHPEFGVFNMAGIGEFHIVVDAFLNSSDYRLEVDVQPLALGLTNGPGMSAAGLRRFQAYGQGHSFKTVEALEVRETSLRQP